MTYGLKVSYMKDHEKYQNHSLYRSLRINELGLKAYTVIGLGTSKSKPLKT